MSLGVLMFSFCRSVLTCITYSCVCMCTYNVFLWEERLHKCPLCQYHRQAQATPSDACLCTSWCWKCLFFLVLWIFCFKSLCRSMLYLYGSWSSDVYNIIGVVFCSRSYNVFLWEERLHKCPLCQYHRQAEAMTVTCVCVYVWVCHHVESVFLFCWFWNFCLRSLCRIMIYLYGAATIVV